MKGERYRIMLGMSSLIAVLLGMLFTRVPENAVLMKTPRQLEWNGLQLDLTDDFTLVSWNAPYYLFLLRPKPGFAGWLAGKPLGQDSSSGRVYFFQDGAYRPLSTWEPLELKQNFPSDASEELHTDPRSEYIRCFAGLARATSAHRRLQVVIEFSNHSGSIGFVGADNDLPALVRVVQTAVHQLAPSQRGNSAVASCIARSIESV